MEIVVTEDLINGFGKILDEIYDSIYVCLNYGLDNEDIEAFIRSYKHISKKVKKLRIGVRVPKRDIIRLRKRLVKLNKRMEKCY